MKVRVENPTSNLTGQDAFYDYWSITNLERSLFHTSKKKKQMKRKYSSSSIIIPHCMDSFLKRRLYIEDLYDTKQEKKGPTRSAGDRFQVTYFALVYVAIFSITIVF